VKPRGGEGQNGRLKSPMGFLVLFSSARLSKWRLALEALVEILTDRDSDLRDLDEESDFCEPSDPEESSEKEMSEENVENSPDECKCEESKVAAGWWVYKALVGKGLMLKIELKQKFI